MTDDSTFKLISAWEQFKQVNDARLRESDRKGHADPLFSEHLRNINTTLDGHSAPTEQTQRSVSPPDSAGGEYGRAFRDYLRKGLDAGLESPQARAMSAGSDPDGGYLTTPAMSARIVRAVFESSAMRQLAAVETMTSDSLELVDDRESAESKWTAEAASVEDTSTPKVAKRSIPTHELYAQPKATQKLVDDAGIDIEGWLSTKIADIFARTQNAAFITGTGVGMPRGILTFAAGTGRGQVQQFNSGAAGQVTSDGLIHLFYSLKDEHARRASFLMNRSTVQACRMLKDAATGHYLWQPGLSAGEADTLLGVPVNTAPDMPLPAAHALAVALADFRTAYQIVDRQGIRILRDPYTEKPFVKFYATTRVGGDVVNPDAIKLLKLAA